MTQATDYDTGTVRASTHENADDKQARLIQEMAEELERCIKLPRTDIASDMGTTLDNIAGRANSTLVFSSTGAIVAGSSTLASSVVPTTYMLTLLDDVDAATARATLGLSTTDNVEFAAFTATTGTFSGTITANAGLTLGASDDLVGSATSDIIFNTDKFTVTGSTGDVVIAGDVTMATAKTLTVEKLVAVDSTGLLLQENGGLGMIIEYSSGDVVIGSGAVAPEHRLEVYNDAASDYVFKVINDGNNANRRGMRIQAGADDGTGTTTFIQFMDGDGEATIGTIDHTNGTLAINQASDERLKKNIKPTKINGLDAIRRLKIKDYNRLGADVLTTGMVAQDVLAAIPEAVFIPEDPNEYMGFYWAKIFPYMIKANQELLERVETLEANLP